MAVILSLRSWFEFSISCSCKKIFIHVIESIIMRGIIGSLNKRFFSHLLTNGDFTQVLLFDLEIVICGKSLDFSISCSYKKNMFIWFSCCGNRKNQCCLLKQVIWNPWFLVIFKQSILYSIMTVSICYYALR